MNVIHNFIEFVSYKHLEMPFPSKRCNPYNAQSNLTI